MLRTSWPRVTRSSASTPVGYYKDAWLYHGPDRAPLTLVKDIREINVDDLAGIDAVVHMAELSNDPLGALIHDVTYE